MAIAGAADDRSGALNDRELQQRADLLAYIDKTEGEAEWTDLEERQERSNLLTHIEKAEGEAEWSDLEELRERAALLERIAKAEEV
jgi:hypothetical protein